MTLPTNSSRVREAVAQVQALRELTRQTGTRTTRSQGLVLQSLTDQELIAASLLLKDTNDGNADNNK
jgi:hypothetical protein